MTLRLVAPPAASAVVVDRFDQERRFVLGAVEADVFLRALAPRMAPTVYDAERPVAYTRTTYLDTEDLSCLRSCAGAPARRLRVREYAFAVDRAAPPVLTGLCFLELKQTMGAVRSKVRLEAPADVLARVIGADPGDIVAVLNGQRSQFAALRAIQQELGSGRFAPRVSTWYRRTSFSGSDGVRVTLDEDLAFSRPALLGQPGERAAPTGVVAYGPARVLEIKSLGVLPDWLERALAPLSEVHGFSKFCLGMEAILGQPHVDQPHDAGAADDGARAPTAMTA